MNFMIVDTRGTDNQIMAFGDKAKEIEALPLHTDIIVSGQMKEGKLFMNSYSLNGEGTKLLGKGTKRHMPEPHRTYLDDLMDVLTPKYVDDKFRAWAKGRTLFDLTKKFPHDEYKLLIDELTFEADKKLGEKKDAESV